MRVAEQGRCVKTLVGVQRKRLTTSEDRRIVSPESQTPRSRASGLRPGGTKGGMQ